MPRSSAVKRPPPGTALLWSSKSLALDGADRPRNRPGAPASVPYSRSRPGARRSYCGYRMSCRPRQCWYLGGGRFTSNSRRAELQTLDEAAERRLSAGVADEPTLGRRSSAAGPEPQAWPDWAALLTRVFGANVLHCPRRGGQRRNRRSALRAETVRPLAERLGLDVPAVASPTSRSPPAPAG